MLELHHAREDNRPCSIRALAHALSRNPSTISRELRRLGDAPYDVTLAAVHTRSFVPEELRIQNRPEEIGDRLISGHWEGAT